MRSFNVTILTLITAYSFGQRPPLEPLEFIQWEVQKRKAMMRILDIPQEQAAAFWEVYEEYEYTRRTLVRERIKILNYLARSRSAYTTNMYAKKLLMNDLNFSRTCKNFFDRLKGVCSRTDASQFIIAEKYFQELFIEQLAPFAQDPPAKKPAIIRTTTLPY